MVFYAYIYAYLTLQIREIDQLIISLNDENPNDSTIRVPADYKGNTIQSAIDFHEAINHKSRDVHPTLLIIVDTDDHQEKGVLLVNLDYHNHIDAVRMPVQDAGAAICSLRIENTSWQETRESCKDLTPPMTASRQFLVYGLELDSKDLDTAVQSMNDGLGALNEDEGGFAEARDVYVEGPCERNLDTIKAGHEQVARGMGCSENMFAVVERDYKHEGVLLVKLAEGGSRQEVMKKKLPLAGEVSDWLHLGLWDWNELYDIS